MEVPTVKQRWSWLAAQAPHIHEHLRRRFGPDLGSDAAQDAIMRAGSSDSAVQSVPWLLRVGINRAIDIWRQRRRAGPLPAALLPDIAATAAERDELRRAIRRLPDSDRRLLAALAAGATRDEIARRHRISREALRQRIARARARLLAELEGKGGAP